MASAICGAEDLARPLEIIWIQQHSYTANPAELFDLSHTPFQLINMGYATPHPSVASCLSPEDWERISSSSRDICIKSYGHFYQKDEARWLAALRSIQPHPAVVDKVNTILSSAPAPKKLVGVHIRRTDNSVSCLKSKTIDFIFKMAAYPPDTHFYIASDDDEERYYMRETFKERAHFGATVLNRTTEAGGLDAWVDLLCLSRCDEIIGSKGSSFSEIAAALGGCPLTVICSE
jgi:hypothetical protein